VGGRTLVAVGRAPKGQFRWYPGSVHLAVPTSAIRDAVTAEAPRLSAQCHVLPYAIDTEAFHPPAGAAPDLSSRLLYAGRLHPEKGVHLLLAAFRQVLAEHPELTLAVIGPSAADAGGGGEAYLAQLRELAKGLPVEWHEPSYDPSRLADLYRSCAWFVYPSLAESGESFGVAPLEAMACGCVPLLSKLRCFEDFVEPGLNGWVFDHRAHDPAATLAAALDQMLRRDRTPMAAKARASAGRFSADAVATLWLQRLGQLQVASCP